jgi:diguanylate cyclase (GGDEF)-like protein
MDSELLVLEGEDFFRGVYGYPAIALKVLSAVGRTMASWLDESSRFLNDLVRWGETARRRAVEDSLTGLFNRRFLDDSLRGRCDALVSGGRPFSLLMMDLDRFRDINARFGSAGGDKTIAAVAESLRPALRDNHVAARLSGDEFAFLLPEAEIGEALETAELIRSRVESIGLALIPVGGTRPEPVPVAASLGAAAAPVHGRCPEGLTGSADRALCRAKEGGRNRVVAATPIEG